MRPASPLSPPRHIGGRTPAQFSPWYGRSVLRRPPLATAVDAVLGGILDLHAHGSAVRCLLRLCEQDGLSPRGDRRFFDRYLARFPAWAQRPGALTGVELEDLARDLGLATSLEWTRDYDVVVAAHAAGDRILALTEHPPLPTGIGRRPHPTTSLVVSIDSTEFTLWWPSPEGDARELPRTPRVWWNRWPVRAAVLRQSASSDRFAP